MADNLLLFLQPASFRGIPFKFIAHKEKGGRKSVVFEYPNEDRRFVQDLGKYQRIFDMDCYINSQDVDYLALRQLFVNALTREGSGILIHPYLGALTVFAKPYDLSEGIDEFGYATFRVQFFETGNAVFPALSDFSKATIVSTFINYLQSSKQDFDGSWKVSTNNFNNLSYATDTLLPAVNNTFSALPGNAPSGTATQKSEFEKSLQSFNDNAVVNSLDSSLLSTSLQDLFDKAGNLSSDLDERIAVIQSIFNFNSADPITDSKTTIEDEREKNRKTINQYINSSALYYDYIFTVSKIFDTEDQIEEKSQQLTNQFGVVILNNLFINTQGEKFEILSTDTISVIEDARTQTHNYLNSQDVDNKRIFDLNISRTSLLPFTFRYYGNLDLLETLYDLNNINNAGNISGNFKLISDENTDTN